MLAPGLDPREDDPGTTATRIVRCPLRAGLVLGGLVLGGLTAAAAAAWGQAATVAAPRADFGAEYPLRHGAHAAAEQAPSRDADLVVGVVVGGEARAYPLNLLWDQTAHTVNDELGRAPIAVALCPLAGSGQVFLRRTPRGTLDIGHVSEVWRDSLVLYDLQTHSRWGLLTGEALSGPSAGHRLERLPSLLTTWGRWKQLHPATTAYVSPELAEKGYQLDDARLRRIVVSGAGPPRRGDWVVGLQGPRTTAAVFVRGIAKQRVLNTELDGRPIVLFVTQDLATTIAWERRVRGRVLTFAADGDRLTDAETGSRWDPLSGRALQGRLRGRALAAVSQTNAFWQAWQANHPGTTVLGLPADGTTTPSP